MNKRHYFISLALVATLLLSGCHKFTFFDVSVPEDRNPLLNMKTPTTAADTYFDDPKHILVQENQPGANPDEGGAFDNWATCLVMIKEGHDHGQGKLHGNYVYPNAPWKQEQFAVIRNTTAGVTVEVDRRSTATFLEATNKPELQLSDGVGPDYFRVVGGPKKLWGFCLYFYDKDGNLINDKVYDQAEEYQIFFSISDVDDKGVPYDVMDVRFRNGLDAEHYKTMTYKPRRLDMKAFKEEQPIPAEFFAGKTTFEQRQKLTRTVFRYTYRDTWTQDDMADGVRTLYNIKLIPPLLRSEYFKASIPQDQEYVGLKGHLEFDYKDAMDEKVLDDREPLVTDNYSGESFNAYQHPGEVDSRPWPVLLSKKASSRVYSRTSNLLPQFYLAVRVMKCEKGKKRILPSKGVNYAINAKAPHADFICQEFDNPKMAESGWQEVIRFNIPVKVYTSAFDSDPTSTDPYEPYYFHLGREIGLTPEEAFEAVANIKTHGATGTGGMGYGAWFL